MSSVPFDLQQVDRRSLLGALALIGCPAFPALAAGFNADTVDRMARDLSRRPYSAPHRDLPPALAALDYDGYRDTRFDRAKAGWGDRYIVEPMLRWRMAADRVEINRVEGGKSALWAFDDTEWDFAKRGRARPDDPQTGYSGFRILGPINQLDVRDEIIVFQGASYFRSLGHGQLYGLSARGLAIGTGGPAEEFPVFRTFWLERPMAGRPIVIHALLDGPSVTGAYRFAVTPAAPGGPQATVVDVDARLYPRMEIATVGIAPMSSMFLFGPASARRFDDFRRAVHDSDGLAIWTGAGERIWRPLTNANHVRVSAFADENLRGFGLIQRGRDFADYQDLEAHYERRPSLWIEPVGQWGKGSVQLVELPGADETGDNIAAFWRPERKWSAGRVEQIRYRLHWGDGAPAAPALARAVATRIGATVIGDRIDGRRHAAIDFAGEAVATGADDLKAEATASAGTLSPLRLQPLPGGAVRVSLDLALERGKEADVRVKLVGGGRVRSETVTVRMGGEG